MSVKLTKAQVDFLGRCEVWPGGYPGPRRAALARSLVNKGLLSQTMKGEPYCITEAGRLALKESRDNDR